MFLIPGELFPELYNGEFLNTETSANKKNANYTPLIKMTDIKNNFVVGLCNDELGYIIPDNDFYLNKECFLGLTVTMYIIRLKKRFSFA